MHIHFCVCVCRGQKSVSGIFWHHFQPCMLRQNLFLSGWWWPGWLVCTSDLPFSSVPVLMHTVPSFFLFTWRLAIEIRSSHLCSNILVMSSFPQPLIFCFLGQDINKEPSMSWNSRCKPSWLWTHNYLTSQSLKYNATSFQIISPEHVSIYK